MNDMTPYGLPRLIPLSDLTLSPLNHRQTVAEAEIAAMADSIALCGLLQNLIGLERDGRVEIVGGGKRLRALHLLGAEGWRRKVGQVPIDPVPVLVTDDEHRAVAWSGAENTARSELGPADEIESYAALQARGTSVAMIAATFAVSEQHVQRRLRLASLPADVLANLRAGKINIDQARALTMALDDRTCVEMLGRVLTGNWNAHMIRSALTADTIQSTDRRAVFVGLDTYRAEGGALTEDLFTEVAQLHNEALLDQLFDVKGRMKTEQLRAEQSWAWAEFKPSAYFDWDWVIDLDKLSPVPGELPEGDLEEYDELSELADGNALSDEGQARYDELDQRLRGTFSDDDIARGGIICWVNSKGELQSSSPYGRPAPKDAADSSGESPAPSKPETIPQNLRDDLRAIRLRAIQTRLFDRHELLLDLLAFSLSSEVYAWNRPLAVSHDLQKATPEKADGLNDDTRFVEDKSSGPSVDPEAAWPAFRAKGKKHRNEVLTAALARAWKLPTGPLADLIADDVDADIRAIWTPTAAGYLGRLPAPALDRIWAELVPQDCGDHTAFAAMKKAGKAGELEKLFMDMAYREVLGLSRAQNAAIDAWLPEELRFAAPADDTP